MTSSQDRFSDHHIFSRRHGYKPLPKPMREAMFMFGACATFAAYLTNKHRQAGGQGPDSQ